MFVVKFYIDSVIILDYLKSRNNKSIQFLENLKDKNEWIGYTSSFTKLELIDNLQSLEHMGNLAIKENKTLDEITRTRNQRRLTKQELVSTVSNVGKFFNKFEKNITLFDLDEMGWNRAIELCKTVNITAKDVIHLAVALEAKCDYFITNDSDLINNVKTEKLIMISNPMNIMGLLEKDKIPLKGEHDEFSGIIVKILDRDFESGLFKRCKNCKNVLDKGICKRHGKVEGYYDLGLRAIAYNGFFEVRINFEKKDIEKYFDLTLDKAKEMATEALDQHAVIEFFERKLKGKFFIIKGINYNQIIKITSIKPDKSISVPDTVKLYEKWISETEN